MTTTRSTFRAERRWLTFDEAVNVLDLLQVQEATRQLRVGQAVFSCERFRNTGNMRKAILEGNPSFEYSVHKRTYLSDGSYEEQISGQAD
jgi:hypothetical protein